MTSLNGRVTLGTTRALYRFMLRSGARVALRANGIVGAAVVFVFALDMDAVAKLRIAILQVVAHAPGIDARAELAALCVALARLAVPRVTLGLAGWIRSLPVAGAYRRRAAVAALTTIQVFLIAFVLVGVIAAVTTYHARLDVTKIASMPVVFVAASMVALPVGRNASRMVAGAALALAVPGRVLPTVIALVALLVADGLAGDIAPVSQRRLRAPRRVPTARSASIQWVRFTLKTLPAGSIVSGLILPGLCTIFTALIILRNPDIDAAMVGRTIRIGGMLGIIAIMATLAITITRTRPAWPWARSLPWSSHQRVLGDSTLQAAVAVPIVVILSFFEWRSSLALACIIPSLAVVAASAIRVGGRRQGSAAGETVFFGVIAGTMVTVWPWTSVIALAVTPACFALATRRDRTIVASRFEELHHDAVGDPAWTGP